MTLEDPWTAFIVKHHLKAVWVDVSYCFEWKIKDNAHICLQEIEIKKQEEYEEHLKEKLMIDEVVRKIYEEDQR